MPQMLRGMERSASEAVRWQVVQCEGDESGGVSCGRELDSMRRVRLRGAWGESGGQVVDEAMD